VGGVVLGGVIATLMTNQKGPADALQLEEVPTAALSQVEGTLAPDQAARLMSEARSCREPLARVSIWHSAATAGGVVSIVSGAYHSPRFALTSTPRIVALPFPAAYQVGQGVLNIVGEASDFGIALRPPHAATQIKGTSTIRVWWRPVGGCP
jgi:hypothetical protein